MLISQHCYMFYRNFTTDVENLDPVEASVVQNYGIRHEKA